MSALDCPECELDEKAIEQWRVTGGRMPRKLCQVDHRPICKTEDCNNRHEFRTSGYCDKCWETVRKERKAKAKKPRLNPLDVLKVPGQWIIK